MKYCTLISLFFFSVVYSQKAFKSTKNIFSDNKQFHVQVKGYFYEGFSSDQEISLINANNDTLWKQIVPRRFLIYPVVSNKGDVAITHREIKIYDKSNNLKGTYPFKKRESPYNITDYMGTVHNFSNNAERYYIFMFSGSPGNDVALYCLSDSVNIIWKSNVGKYWPHQLLFYKNKVIANDCGTAGLRYANFCYVFNESGKIIWKYKAKFRHNSDWQVNLDKKKGILFVKDASAKINLDLNTLSDYEY